MADSYPIIQVHPEWVLEQEDMGTKEKFWYRKPGEDESDWLFKQPRPGTGEHWAEKIAAEVAMVLGIRHATVELAEFREEHQKRRGSASESFVADDQELVHGNQVLEWTVVDYDPSIRFGQSDHSFENIWNSLDRVFEEREAAEEIQQSIAGYLILDAVIGNTDRHHENWGLLRRRAGSRWVGRLAPSFDHASSLGRELLDRRRLQLTEERRVGQYSKKGRGGIYWSRDARYGPSPLELVRMAVAAHPSSFGASLESLTGLRDGLVSKIVNRVPSDWMSRSAREFAINLITFNRNQLMELSR